MTHCTGVLFCQTMKKCCIILYLFVVFLDDQAQFAEFVKKSNSSGQQGAGSAKQNRNVIVLPKSSRSREVKVPLKYRGNIHILRKHILGLFVPLTPLRKHHCKCCSPSFTYSWFLKLHTLPFTLTFRKLNVRLFSILNQKSTYTF